MREKDKRGKKKKGKWEEEMATIIILFPSLI